MSEVKMLNIKGKLITLERPVVMGILNVTPDSFYAGSRRHGEDAVVERIETILYEGGDWIDIGGYSTRPNAPEVSTEEEWRRLEPAFDILAKKYGGIPVSVDTFRAEIARRAVQNYGVAMINDISGGALDTGMFTTVAALQVPYILTHFQRASQEKPQNQGKCNTLQQNQGESDILSPNPDFNRLLEAVMLYFAKKIQCLRSLGVNDVMIDPGFGFGKTLEQNYVLMRSLKNFTLLFDSPLLVGVSRKSMIYNLLGCTADESLNGTTVLNAYSLLHGADILRVHDVKAAVEVVKLVDKLKC